MPFCAEETQTMSPISTFATLAIAAAIAALPCFAVAAVRNPPDQPPAASRLTVKNQVKPAHVPFEPGEVTILEGPFRRALEANARYLRSLEPDRLLAGFREVAGLPPKA